MNFNLSSKCLACVVSVALVFNSFSSAAFASESTRPKKEKDCPDAPSFSGSLAVTSGNAAHELVRKCKLPGANVEEILFQLCVLFMPNPTLGTERNEDGLTPLDLALTLGCPVEVESLCYAYRYPFDGKHSVKERMEYWSSIRDLLPNIPPACLIGFLNKFDNEKDMTIFLRGRCLCIPQCMSNLDKEKIDTRFILNFFNSVLFWGDMQEVKSLIPNLRQNLSLPRSRDTRHVRFDFFSLIANVLDVWLNIACCETSKCSDLMFREVEMMRKFLDVVAPSIDVGNSRWKGFVRQLMRNYSEHLCSEMMALLKTHPVTKAVFNPMLRSVCK